MEVGKGRGVRRAEPGGVVRVGGMPKRLDVSRSSNDNVVHSVTCLAMSETRFLKALTDAMTVRMVMVVLRSHWAGKDTVPSLAIW